MTEHPTRTRGAPINNDNAFLHGARSKKVRTLSAEVRCLVHCCEKHLSEMETHKTRKRGPQ